MHKGSRIFALAAAAAVTFAWSSAAQEAPPPASARLAEYLKAFNSGSPEAMRDFFRAHYAGSSLRETPVESRVARYSVAKARLQSLELQKILAERTNRTFALVRAGNGQNLLLRAGVEKAPPHKLEYIFLEPVDDPETIILPDPKASDEEFRSAAREYLQAQARADEFSGVVLVAKNEAVIFHEAYGYADREKKTPNLSDTKFNLGSINKNFTRVAVLQLAKQGKLSLDDPIKKFLPDYPNPQAAEKVTIRHLLEMTSGIGDFFGRRYEETPKEKIRSLRDYLPLFADLPLVFEPGTNSRYSNGGYIVLGAIIEKVSGLDYYAYVRETIFKPCGMLDTDSFERDADVPNLARGYTRESPGGAWVLNHSTLPGRGSSAGGGYSTAGDLLKYVRALERGKIFLPDAANGLGIAGGAPGINSSLEYDPRRGILVIVLTNFDPPTAGEAARRFLSWLPE